MLDPRQREDLEKKLSKLLRPEARLRARRALPGAGRGSGKKRGGGGGGGGGGKKKKKGGPRQGFRDDLDSSAGGDGPALSSPRAHHPRDPHRRPQRRSVRPDGDYVLYWMIAFRRLGWNFGLERAAGAGARARPAAGGPGGAALRLPVGERPPPPLRARRHGGAAAPARAVERPLLPLRRAASPGRARGCSRRSPRGPVVVVTDDFPAFFLPRMVAAAAEGCGSAWRRWTPTACFRCGRRTGRSSRPTSSAATCRRTCRRTSTTCRPRILSPRRCRAARALCRRRSCGAGRRRRRISWRDAGSLAALPIDHAVAPVPGVRGGDAAGAAVLARFLDERLGALRRGAQPPGRGRASGLSPYLHFGHVCARTRSSRAVAERERLDPGPARRLDPRREGRLVGDERGRGGVPRRGRHLARAGLQPGLPPRRLRPLRVAARVGPAHARGAREGSPARPLRSRRVRGGADPRRAVERGAAPARRAKGASTTTCACSGARRSSSGRPPRARRWT